MERDPWREASQKELENCTDRSEKVVSAEEARIRNGWLDINHHLAALQKRHPTTKLELINCGEEAGDGRGDRTSEAELKVLTNILKILRVM